MNIHKSMDKWRLIYIKHGYPFMDIYCLRISISECPCTDTRAWISRWISTLVWIIEDWHPKIMDVHVDIRGFLEIHAWICHGFSDQGCHRISLPKSPNVWLTVVVLTITPIKLSEERHLRYPEPYRKPSSYSEIAVQNAQGISECRT